MADQPHILVVDDNETLVQVLKLQLEALGMRVLTAHDGFEALRVLLSERVDLVVADYHMPGVNGEDLLSTLRDDERYRGLPVILITGAGYELDTKRFRTQYNLTAVFFKPLSVREVAHAVNAALSRPQPEKLTQYDHLVVG